MKIKRTVAVFDTADLHAESTFWADLLGGTVFADDDWHSVHVEGGPTLGFQLAPNHQPPDWPDGQPQQVHLDIYVDDIHAAHEHAIAVGARFLQAAEDFSTPDGFQVYADPSGHPFCLCWG